MKFIAIYRDPKKKNLQRLELLVVLLALPLALVWGAGSYEEWKTFREAERLYQEGDLYLHQGKSDLAVESLEKSVALYPQFHGAWEALAATHHLKNDHDKELEAYRRAVAVLPEIGELRRELGTAYHESGAHDKELEQLTLAQEILGKDEVFTMRLLDRAQREVAGTYPAQVAKGPEPVPNPRVVPIENVPDHGHNHAGEGSAPEKTSVD